MLEYSIATPGTPVFVSQIQPDGRTNAIRSRSTRRISALTNDELDALLSSILEIFPTFGQWMIVGHLKASGHHVPRECITESFLQVHGTPGVFGQCTIHRKVYKVAGANSLWHHDGQHGQSQNTSVLNSPPGIPTAVWVKSGIPAAVLVDYGRTLFPLDSSGNPVGILYSSFI